jgi:hypothetical protein
VHWGPLWLLGQAVLRGQTNGRGALQHKFVAQLAHTAHQQSIRTNVRALFRANNLLHGRLIN